MSNPRIFCIGCNYSEHNREMNSPKPDELVIFMKPYTCIISEGEPIALPSHSNDIHHEVEVVVRISEGGRDIPVHKALNYIDAYSIGLDLTARDVQNRQKEKGLPWETCKAFDGSAPLGKFIPISQTNGTLVDVTNLTFRCMVDGNVRQQGCTADMIFPIPVIISQLSRIWSLNPGDLIYTGTPPGVGQLLSGQIITIESEKTGKESWRVI